MSFRQTLANSVGSSNGTLNSGEADPLGNGVGINGIEYVEQSLPPERDFPLAQARHQADTVMYRNGTIVQCIQDGAPISCARQQRNMEDFAVPHEVGHYQRLQQRYPWLPDLRFESIGLGMFRMTFYQRREVGYDTKTEYWFAPISWSPQQTQQPFVKPIDDLAAFLDKNKNCAGLLAALFGLFKKSSDLGDLPIVDATSNNPAVLDMTLDEVGLVPGSNVKLRDFKNPDSLAEAISGKVYIYDRYFNHPDYSSSAARGSIVFHEIFHTLLGTHAQIIDALDINYTEPEIPKPPSDYAPYTPNREELWKQKYRHENRRLFDAAASAAMQKWIDNDCKN